MDGGSYKRGDVQGEGGKLDAAHIRLWKESGLTQIEYCRQNNLTKHTFTYWKCKRHIKNELVEFVLLYPRHAKKNPTSNEKRGH